VELEALIVELEALYTSPETFDKELTTFVVGLGILMLEVEANFVAIDGFVVELFLSEPESTFVELELFPAELDGFLVAVEGLLVELESTFVEVDARFTELEARLVLELELVDLLAELETIRLVGLEPRIGLMSRDEVEALLDVLAILTEDVERFELEGPWLRSSLLACRLRKRRSSYHRGSLLRRCFRNPPTTRHSYGTALLCWALADRALRQTCHRSQRATREHHRSGSREFRRYGSIFQEVLLRVFIDRRFWRPVTASSLPFLVRDLITVGAEWRWYFRDRHELLEHPNNRVLPSSRRLEFWTPANRWLSMIADWLSGGILSSSTRQRRQ
jgi:hypothetical protein